MSKIFILEDSEIVSSIIKMLLEKMPPSIDGDVVFLPVNNTSSIKTFTNIEGLLDEISESPDLLIIDHLLGYKNGKKTNGMDLVDELDRMNIKIPIIVSSGQMDKDVVSEYKRRGVVDYISKDGENFIDELCKSVDNVLRNKKTNKIKVTKITDFIYTETKEIEIEVPDGTEDIESFLKEYIEDNDDMEEEFNNSDTTEEFSDPEHLHYSFEENGETKYWKDF